MPEGLSQEATRVADFLLGHVGGNESEPWQAGHNYAMREAARLIREQWHLLDYGLTMPCPGCGNEGPHQRRGDGSRVECGEDTEDGYTGCGDSWDLDQRGTFSGGVDD